MSVEAFLLTADQAISAFPEGEYVHNFKQGGFMLIGCDYTRDEAEKTIRNARSVEIGGDSCRAMGHGIACWHSENDFSFFAADDAILSQIESAAQ